MLKLHPVVAEVTARIVERSKATRADNLHRMDAAERRAPERDAERCAGAAQRREAEHHERGVQRQRDGVHRDGREPEERAIQGERAHHQRSIPARSRSRARPDARRAWAGREAPARHPGFRSTSRGCWAWWRWRSLPPMPARVARSSRQHASACTSCHRPACATHRRPVRLLPLLCAACGCALRGRRGSRLL
jgi:hypothetical protein